MKKLLISVVLVVTASSFAACTQENKVSNAGNTSNAANAAAAKPAPAAPTKDAIVALEKQAWEAWKNHDPKAAESLMAASYVGFGSAGRMDKAAAVKQMTDSKCEVKSYSWTDEQMTPVGADVALLTFKAAQDFTCDGKKGPAETWSASIYVREGDKWKNTYYAEIPIPQPAGKPKTQTPAVSDAKPDAATEAILAVEKKVWEAWKNKDAKAVEDVLAKDFTYVTGQGRMDRAASVKAWSVDNKCEVKSFSLTDPMAVALTKDVSLLTFVGAADAICEGQSVPTERYAALYIKDGETWRPAFGMGVPMS